VPPLLALDGSASALTYRGPDRHPQTARRGGGTVDANEREKKKKQEKIIVLGETFFCVAVPERVHHPYRRKNPALEKPPPPPNRWPLFSPRRSQPPCDDPPQPRLTRSPPGSRPTKDTSAPPRMVTIIRTAWTEFGGAGRGFWPKHGYAVAVSQHAAELNPGAGSRPNMQLQPQPTAARAPGATWCRLSTAPQTKPDPRSSAPAPWPRPTASAGVNRPSN